MARIAVGGFQHETNTFSPSPATLADFIAADAWPGMVQGPALVEAVAGINLPAAGFIAEARGLRHERIPTRVVLGAAIGPCHARSFRARLPAAGSALCKTPTVSTRFTSTCTVRWSRSTSTMQTVRSCGVCGPSLARTCRWSRASTTTRTCRRKWRHKPAHSCPIGRTLTSTWPRVAHARHVACMTCWGSDVRTRRCSNWIS